MENKMIDGVKVAVNYAQASDAPVSDDEIKAYIKRAYDKYPHGQLESLTLDVDGEDVGIHYGLAPVKFDRIAASPATWWARSTASTTPSAPRSTTASNTRFPPAASNLAFSTHKEGPLRDAFRNGPSFFAA